MQILGNINVENDDFSLGSPIYWRPTPLTAGLLKFIPAITPPSKTVAALRNATRCYATLELAYLNGSVRCWVEPSNVGKTKVQYAAEALRKLLFSTWAISVVLNITAMLITLDYARKLYGAYRITRFKGVDAYVAVTLSLEAFGILSLSQTFQMTISTLPMLLTFHLAADPTFMLNYAAATYPKLVKDVVVALSMTWFFKFGLEATNAVCVQLHVVCY